MKFFLPILILLTFNTLALADDYQLFGTHASLSLSQDFDYSYDILGYISKDRKYYFTANRASADVMQVQKQYEQSGLTLIDTDKNGNKIYYQERFTQGVLQSGYFLPLGNSHESAIITATSFNEDESTRNKILSILKTARWNKNSNLNFEKAYYFEIKNLYGLAPSAIVGLSFIFTPDGRPFENSKMSLSIARFPLPYDHKDKEKQILDYCANPNRLSLKVLNQDYKKIEINGLSGMMLSRRYVKNGKELKGKLAVLFTPGKVITIEAESPSIKEDKYLDDYENILNNFFLKEQ